MNMDVANRLFELRKKKNLSQEELADRIGVSRQAVSKWERAESSPDTSNLIELAKLYEVSLDELLFTTEPTKRPKKEGAEFVSISLDGIHVIEKDGSEVHVGLKGIKVKNSSDPDFDPEIDMTWDEAKIKLKTQIYMKSPVALLTLAAYLILGFCWNLWHPGWLIFFAIPIYYETFAMFTAKGTRKKLHLFPMALIVTAAYLIAGLCYSLWHPTWLIFLLIPLYHSIVNAVAGKE